MSYKSEGGVSENIVIGRVVSTFHRGRVRVGKVSSEAPKATISRGERCVWVDFEDADLDPYYRRVLKPVHLLEV